MSSNRRMKVGVVFGGRSPEHEVSFKSGLYVLSFLDPGAWEPYPVYIRGDGRLASAEELARAMERWFGEPGLSFFDSTHPEPSGFGERVKGWLRNAGTFRGLEDFCSALRDHALDVVFPVIHGATGEDGALQGMLEFLNVPYAGCGITQSVLCIDKVFTKRICGLHGIPVVDYEVVDGSSWERDAGSFIERIEERLSYPLFVKPARCGSSVGVSRADDRGSLGRSVGAALRYDGKALVEKCIAADEFPVGVLGNGNPATTLPARFMLHDDFYDYEAKYGASALPDIIPADVDEAASAALREFAVRVYRALGLSGFARVDMFMNGDGIFLNEVNTIPGLGGHSVFNRMWEVSGTAPRELFDRILSYALESHAGKNGYLFEPVPEAVS